MLKLHSHKFLFLAVASALFCTIVSAKSQEKVQLRLHLRTGQTFDQEMTTEAKSSVTDQNKRTDRVTTAHNALHDEVLSVDEAGTVKLKIVFQSMSMKEIDIINGKVQSVSGYDSTKQNSPAFQCLSALIGQSVVVSISSRGQVLKIEGVDAIINKTTESIKVPIVRMYTGGFLREFLESTIKQSNEMVIFAKTPVAVGGSWRGYPIHSLLGSTQLNVKYTLFASKNSIATVAMIAHIKSALTESLDGVLHVDEKTGLIISSELHQQNGDKPLKTSMKSTANEKSNIGKDSAFRVSGQATVHSWIVNLSP